MNPAATESATGEPPIRSVVAPDINPIGGGIVDDSQAGELCDLARCVFLAHSMTFTQGAPHAPTPSFPAPSPRIPFAPVANNQPTPPPATAGRTAPSSRARRLPRRAHTPQTTTSKWRPRRTRTTRHSGTRCLDSPTSPRARCLITPPRCSMARPRPRVRCKEHTGDGPQAGGGEAELVVLR